MEGKVIGIGGIFFKFKDPAKMNKWYADVLGLVTNDYGVLFSFNTSDKTRGFLQLGTFPEDSDYFGRATQQSMINFRVAEMDKLVERLKKNDVTILNDMETFEYGKFIHISDPEGNRIELWEPIDDAFSTEPTTIML
jgi:predicted enzyme related to lactoylglutathione lyase